MGWNIKENELEALFLRVAEGEISAAEAMKETEGLSFEDLGFAKVDFDRSQRTGRSEVIYGQGKKPEQIASIAAKLQERSERVLISRITEDAWETLVGLLPGARYFAEARIVTIGPWPEPEEGKGGIVVITAGTADIPTAEEAAVTAEFFGNHVERIYDVGVSGIHRLFARLEQIRRAGVVVVVAGMEGALASVVGGLVSAPVVAVPTSVGYGANLGGISALLSMLNSCANGVGVVNIDNGYGAACLASKINIGR